jgi:hypothetical protein
MSSARCARATHGKQLGRRLRDPFGLTAEQADHSDGVLIQLRRAANLAERSHYVSLS